MQTCSICAHADRPQIEAARAAGGSLRAVAQQFAVSSDALHRHGRHSRPVPQYTPQIEVMRRALERMHARLHTPPHNILAVVEVLRDMTRVLDGLVAARQDDAGDLK